MLTGISLSISDYVSELQIRSFCHQTLVYLSYLAHTGPQFDVFPCGFGTYKKKKIKTLLLQLRTAANPELASPVGYPCYRSHDGPSDPLSFAFSWCGIWAPVDVTGVVLLPVKTGGVYVLRRVRWRSEECRPGSPYRLQKTGVGAGAWPGSSPGRLDDDPAVWQLIILLLVSEGVYCIILVSRFARLFLQPHTSQQQPSKMSLGHPHPAALGASSSPWQKSSPAPLALVCAAVIW